MIHGSAIMINSRKLKWNPGWMTLLFVFFFVFAAIFPVSAWYYFSAKNGQRMQWVFGSSCNPNARGSGIPVYRDNDLPATFNANVAAVIADWNAPVTTPIFNTTVTTYSQNMSPTIVTNFLNNPVPGQIWIVWDSDGTVLNSLGQDSTGGLLGIGIPLTISASRPQDICSGILILNALNINSSTTLFQKTLLHEIGHVLGFAHSISGGNLQFIVSSAANLPVMYPFAYSTSPILLQNDEKAGARTVYGP